MEVQRGHAARRFEKLRPRPTPPSEPLLPLLLKESGSRPLTTVESSPAYDLEADTEPDEDDESGR